MSPSHPEAGDRLAASLHADLGDALAEIAAVLAVPVLLLALTLLIACAYELGRYVMELWRRDRRRRAHGSLTALAAAALADPVSGHRLAAEAGGAFVGAAVERIATAAASPEDLEHALTDYELAVQRRLDRTRIIVRAGPAVGLMGTLIPLAPGMEALGRGDVEALAGDLRIAFAATVIGLLAGTVAFALTLGRTRIYTEDLTALERATEAARAPSARPGAAR